MRRRIWALTAYFWSTTQLSLTGTMYVILALAYWWLLFNPRQESPHTAYYVLVIAAFGAAAAFLLTLSVSARGNQAEHYPFVTRMPSRVEYLTAVMAAALIMSSSLQLLVAMLSLYHGPTLTIGLFIDAIPIWTAVNILAAVLALHASDFVTLGWSRVVVYGILAILLISRSNNQPGNNPVVEVIADWGRDLITQGFTGIGDSILNIAQWLSAGGLTGLREYVSYVFWPFTAVIDGTITGYFTPAQAMAPAVLLLYATVLFLLAADLFATKDLEFME